MSTWSARIQRRFRFYRFRWQEMRRGRLAYLPPLRTAAQGAIEWLMAAQRATPDDGVSQMYDALVGAWGASYPETTGYIIPSLLDAADRKVSDPDRLRRATLRMGRWLLTLQRADGAFPFGTAQSPTSAPSVFNTGQILRGLCRLAKSGIGNRARFLEAGQKAAAWMRSQQDADGAWRRGVSPLTRGAFHTYYVYAASALADFAKTFDMPEALTTAIANAEFVLSLRTATDWIPFMGFVENQPPLLHTVAYTLQGLFDIGRITNRRDFIQTAERAARCILKLQDPQTGALPGRLAENFVPDVKWSSMTGNSQMAILWFELAASTSDPAFETAARRANAFNRSIQDLHDVDEGRHGGLRGNYPTSPGYGCGQYFSWTQKFFLDALLKEMDRDDARPKTVKKTG